MNTLLDKLKECVEEHENNYERKIRNLETRIEFLLNERKLIIDHLQSNKIELLKEYFYIDS